jgi:hypothetical protein
MTQPGLIESVLADLHLLDDSKTKDTRQSAFYIQTGTTSVIRTPGIIVL